MEMMKTYENTTTKKRMKHHALVKYKKDMQNSSHLAESHGCQDRPDPDPGANLMAPVIDHPSFLGLLGLNMFC